MGVPVKDMGPKELIPDDDYPDYVIPLIQEMKKDENSMGILICKNGVGVSMLANKFKGIRCALSWSGKHAATSRADDDSNVLALPAEFLTREEALDVVYGWLNTDFSKETRHIRRLEKVSKVEN